MTSAIADLNKRRWTGRGAVSAYQRVQPVLQKAEETILGMLAEEFRGRRILDIGVGCGRTTPHLLKISKRYVGIDYSPAMIACCNRCYPNLDFQTCDARDLSRFADAAFDLVMFSYNGIDCVEHAGRLKILAEVHRVCADTGAFVFSSHNLKTLGKRSGNVATPDRPLRPLRALRRVGGSVVRRINHLRLKTRERRETAYAIINDEALRGSLLLYYITLENQVQQLKQHGFDQVMALDTDGRVLNDLDDGRSAWIYYVARKGQCFTVLENKSCGKE